MPLVSTEGLHADCVLLGWTEPYRYEAGHVEGNAFPAGTSFSVVVGIGDEGDFEVLKVKSAGAAQVEAFIAEGVTRGVGIRIEYRPKVPGRNGRPAEMLSLQRIGDLVTAASNGKGHRGSEGG